MPRPGFLHRFLSRLGAGRKLPAAGNEEELGGSSLVPGRDAAAEAWFSPVHTTILSTPGVLGCSALLVAIGGWYWVHAYGGAHTIVRGPGSTTAELSDSPLPPLQPAKATGHENRGTDAHRYAIADILNPDDAAAHGTPDDNVQDRNALTALSNPGMQTRDSSRPTPEARRLDGVVFNRSTYRLTETLPARTDSGLRTGSTSEGEGAGVDANAVDRLLRTDVTPSTSAAVLPTQRLLLPKGAFLDCTLETAIDSTLPGLTTCITAFDTFSADGTVVLLERGTKLIGEMRSQVQQGTARVFVLWTEARTPNGIVVALASPGTDELGRSGLPGTVDRHFADRFGAAILVSMIGGAIQSVVNRSQQQGGGTLILNPSGAGDVATEILRSTLSIPPTVRIPQGERIEVLVARDLDFRSVYSLHTR